MTALDGYVEIIAVGVFEQFSPQNLVPFGLAESDQGAVMEDVNVDAYRQAENFYGTGTAWPGTQCGGESMPPDHLGNCACAAAVSQVLVNAGYTGATSYNVPTLEADLIAAGWTVVPASQAQAGDVAIAPGQEHVGICTSANCNSILSNSSSNSTFSWNSGANFNGAYGSTGEVILAPPASSGS